MPENRIKTVSLAEIFGPLRKNWLIILIAFVSVLLTAGFLTITSDRVYEASATLAILEMEDLRGRIFDYPSVFLQQNRVQNQIAILESRKMAIAVVEKLRESDYADSLIILGNERKIEQSSIREKLISFFKGSDSENRKPTYPMIVGRFQSAARVQSGLDSEIIQLKVRSSDPKEAAYIVNTWVAVYKEFERSISHSEIIQTKQFLELKLKEMEEKLTQSENRLTRYQKQKKVVALTSETEQLVQQLAGFESLYNESKTDLEAVENQLRYLKDQLDENKKNIVENMIKTSNSIITELQEQMAQLVAEKAAYEAQLIGAGYNARTNSRVAQMENRISGIKEKIVEETKKLVSRNFSGINPLEYSENLITQILEVETNRESLIAKGDALKGTVDEYRKKLESLPEKSRELARLERDVQVNSKIYMMLREKYEETRINEAGRVDNIRVVDLAEPPGNPVLPQTGRNIILGSFFGLLLGIGLAFSREYFKNTIQTREE